MISRLEAGKLADLSLPISARLFEAMGARIRVEVDAPFLDERQLQHDPAHARMSGHVDRRLQRDGWQVVSEVEVGGDRSRGWIDLLAVHPVTRLMLVIELKTELHDLGQIDRTLGWYEREAWAAARRLGWRPAAMIGCLILLMTRQNDLAVGFNRDGLRRQFPVRAAHFREILGGDQPPQRGRALAMIDPRSKRQAWLRPTSDEGRRSPAPYVDYADFMRSIILRPHRQRTVARHREPA